MGPSSRCGPGLSFQGSVTDHPEVEMGWNLAQSFSLLEHTHPVTFPFGLIGVGDCKGVPWEAGILLAFLFGIYLHRSDAV